MNEISYEWHIRQAAKYRESARFLDGYQRQAMLGAARHHEIEAKQLLRQASEPGSKTGKPHSE